MNARDIIAFSLVGLYILVTLVVLVDNVIIDKLGDMTTFLNEMSNANFLLGPVGIIVGYYFKQEKKKDKKDKE